MMKIPHPDDAQIGLTIRTIRMRIGMTQEKLGERLGLTFQQVQKYEKGANRVGGSRMAQIARALDVEIATLFQGVEGGGRASVPPRTNPMAERLEALTPSDRAVVDHVIDCMFAAQMAGVKASPPVAPAIQRVA